VNDVARRVLLWSLGVGFLLIVAGCAGRGGSVPPATSADTEPITLPTTPAGSGEWASAAPPCAEGGGWGTCAVAGFEDRPYDVKVPSGYDQATAFPVVVALHGGGGSAATAETMTCPGGDRAEASCLQGLGDVEGFLTVFPNGSGFPPVRRLRTWNAGGGEAGWNCTSGRACAEGTDDMVYLDAVLDDVARRYHVDPDRIYAVGLSNGAALAHRLACERSGRFAAVVAVAGSNQFSTTSPCDPAEPVAVMQVHGTEDPCWTYETSESACVDRGGRKLGAIESITGWVERLGCHQGSEVPVPDVDDDGTSTTMRTWTGCDGGVEVVLATVKGGGHTWPNGDPALPERRVGRVARDWGNERIWAFLSRFGGRG